MVDIFCDFDSTDDIVYTYFSLDTLNLVSDLSVHYNRYDHAKIRLLTDSNKQREAIVRQHPIYQDMYNVSVYVNGHTGFIETRCERPLLYMGFEYPEALNVYNSTGNYSLHLLQVNDNTLAYSICNSYHNNRIVICNEYKSTSSKCYYNDFHKEIYRSTLEIDMSRYFENKYFGRFEISFGGCAEFWLDTCKDDVKAMAIGLPFQSSYLEN